MNTSMSQGPAVACRPVVKAICHAAMCAVGLLAAMSAHAAEWEVDPVRVELSPAQQTAAITLKNMSTQATSIQVQVVKWTQVDGKDVYVSSRELLVSPPIVNIPAGGEQIIRAALRRPADPKNELSYRINLQELPPAPAPGFTGVQVALRIGLPVFVQTEKGGAVPKMEWSIQRMPDNQLKVTLKNRGNAHVQVTDFSLYLPATDQSVAGEAGSKYIMAGQMHEWLLKTSSPVTPTDGRLRLKAFTDAGDVDALLSLGRL